MLAVPSGSPPPPSYNNLAAQTTRHGLCLHEAIADLHTRTDDDQSLSLDLLLTEVHAQGACGLYNLAQADIALKTSYLGQPAET